MDRTFDYDIKSLSYLEVQMDQNRLDVELIPGTSTGQKVNAEEPSRTHVASHSLSIVRTQPQKAHLD